MVNAIVLAGDGGKPINGTAENKALIKIKDRFMVEYIIDSLKSAKCVDRVIVTGSDYLKEVLKDRVESIILCEGSIVSNVRKCMEYLDVDKHVLICTSDIPMVSSEAIEDLVKQCSEKNIDIGYPIIEKSLNDFKYPDVKRTYVKLKDGTYTGGNIIYAHPAAVKKCYAFAEYLVENRKNPLKMGRIFGIFIFIKLALGVLKIESLEKRINKILDINAKAIITSYPEIGNDVDKAEDIEFVIKHMNIGA